MATSNDNLRRLYQNGLKHFSLPDFDTFERDMKDEVKRQRFYTNMQAAYSLPDFDTFSKDIGVVATDSPTPVKPATQTPAQSQERVTSTTVKPLTSTTPQLLSVQQDVQPIAQPAKPEGWEPSPMQHRAFQMQMDEANARLKKQGEDFHQRMEGIDKGNRPGAFMGEREFNPQTGQMGTHYYTQKGERVGSRMEQSRRNSAHRQWWENNTEAGRRSKEQRLQREFDARLSGLWQRHNPAEGENAAEQAWSAAEKRQGIDANRIADDVYHDRGDAISNMVLLGGPENHIMNASENRQRSMVAHFTNFDLDRLMNESWDNLGEDGQKALIDDCYQMLRYRNPGADELVLYNQAKQFARQQSDLRLYNLAVEKNLPKGNLEYLMRKIGDMNVLMNVNKGLAVSSADGKTGDMAAYEAANEQYRQDGHKILDVTGMVAGFALDPTTWLSAGVGSAATRGAMWAGGRWLAGRGASAAVTQAATRQFATSMTGRIVGGVAGGAANFGTFEGVKEMENQFAHGGHIVGQDETGRYINEGYSAGAVAGQFGHGLMMGAAVGWLGPVSGNVSDKLVRATSSTVGKVTTRAGVYTGATLAEGTIFSVPEWIEGKRDAMDVWNDNMAMMVGFKAKHMLKSAGGVLGDLKASFDSPTYGQKNRLDFESRLRQRMDAPSDGGMGLTEDEKAELKRYGYDLRDLVESSERTGDAAEGSLIAQNAPEIVSRLTDMVTDPRISEAARAKMYYFATGRRLPMSTVMRGELIEDGDGGFIVESQGANGVITSRSFKSRKAAELELQRIKRQTELNSIEIGERYQQTADFENRLQEACRTVAAENGWDMVEVYRTCEEARRNHLRGGDKQFDEVQQNILRKVTDAMGEFEETGATDAMRDRINEKYGVDIDGAIRKEASRRTLQEQTAIDEYLNELIPDKAKEANPVEDTQAEDISNQKLLTDESVSPTDSEPIDPRFDSSTDPTPDYNPHQPGGEQTPIGRAVMKYQDRPVEVLSGRVVMMEDGTMIDNERSDTSIVIRDLATGKVEMVSPEAILSYEEYAPNATDEAEPTPTEADDPAGDVQPQSQYTSGQIKIRNSDGTETRGVLTGYVDENGNHEYYVEGDLQHLHYASDHELDNILSEYVPDEVEGEATAGKPTAPGTKADEKNDSDVSDVTDVADEVQGEVSAVAPTETPEEASAGPTALERLPKNEKGEPIFEQAENPEHGWDALVEFAEGDAATAKEIADTMAEEKRKAYEKAQKQKPKGKTPTEILASKKAISAGLAQAEQEYNLWQQMANVEQRRQNAIRAQQEAEARQRAAERVEAEKAEREAREAAARLEREALEGIPEWHLDTPENARKRGVRRFSGQMFTRQEPVQGVVGKEVEVKFSQKDLPKGHLAVIEAPQLQPSHIQGQRNPMFFIEEAQPKNRAEAVSMFAAKEMAEGIRPQEITGSATAYTGAPTVNTRGEVIQGNNRSDALRYLWENKLPEQQQTYKQYLIDNAEQFGLDPEAVNAMQQPVLVNMLDVDDAEAIRLGQMTAQDTESGGVERIKPKNVAQKLGEDMRSFASQLLRSGDEEASFGQLVDRNGTEVLKWMAQKGVITNTQYQSAFDSKGNLTAEAKNDLQKVLYQAVFKGGSQQLEEMFDALPAKAQRAILSTAFRDMDSPFAGKMLPEIQASIAAFNQLMNDPTFAAAKKMEEALRVVGGFKRSIQLDDRFEQYMPADNYSNFALHLAAMYKANDMSQSTLASYFNQMYDLAQGKKAATLFEDADTTEYPLADVIKQVLNIDYKPAKNGNNNVANGGADVALRNQDGQGGELRGNEPPASGEQNPEGAESADRGRGIAGDGRGSGNRQTRGSSEATASQESLSKEEASGIIAEMEERAEVAPEIALTIENWDAEFGESGIVSTPIGDVKMGENQFTKLMRQGRNGKLGMVKPTLENPDIIIEDNSEAKEPEYTERKSSYVYVKTFIKPDGSRYYYFTSVTVSKDGHEVVISNQEKRRNVLTNLLIKGKLVWKHADDVSSTSDVADGLFSPQGNMSDPVSEGTDAPQTNVSDRKVNNSASEEQISGSESFAQPANSKGEQTIQTAVEAASVQVNTEPTPAQAEAGNYKKGHVTIGEFDITIENPAGSVRKGVDADGKEWSNTMANTYGYIKGTEGVDGDHIDVFLHENMDEWNGRKVFVVDQTNTDGSFDEHKVMLGFNDKDEAMAAYLANYDKTWADTHPGLRISETNIEDFNKWVQSSHRKTKPFADYTTVRKEATVVIVERGAPEAAKLRQKSSRLEIEGAEKLSAERAEEVERYVEGHYCAPIRVVADEADIRESGLSDVAVAQMMAALTEEDVPAVYCREDKKIYIFAGHKDSNVGSTLAHENFHALADAIGDARERNRMFEAYRKTLLADPKCGVYFKELWDAVINAYAPEEALEDFVGYTINRMYSAPGFIGHLERILDGDVKEYIFNKFINRIFNGTAQESSKPANQQGNSENDGRMAGLLRRGDSAGSGQAERRADGEESAGGEVADGKAGGAAEAAAMARGREAFDALRDRAVAERGIVMPGLNEKVVRVVEVPRHDFAGNGKEALQAAEKWAKESIVGTHTALDSRGDEFGYTISGDAVEKYVSCSATGKSANIGVHLAALKKLPEIIKESIEAEVHPDYDKLNGIRNAENITNPETLIHRFYGAANVDGTIYRVKTTMREYRDKNRSPLAHSYEITQIELLEAPSDGVINNSGEPLAMTSNSSNVEPTVSPKDSGVPHRIANLLKGVEKSYDPGKKLLEESEKNELFRRGSGSMVSREGDIHFRGHERINAHQQEMAQTSPEAKSSHAEKLAKKFNTPITIVEDGSKLPAQVQKTKGWYEVSSGRVVVVLSNNASVEDVAETVFHEVVAHKGLREMLGEENYDAFCDEVYNHLKDDLKEEVDRETTRRFEREPEKGYEHHRRVSVDEMFGRMAEKGFEDFTKAEIGIWAKLKAKVLEAINKFLGSLRLPKWVKLGDNELRYMLWRSHEKLRSRGSTPNEPSGMDYVDMARDAAKREELGLNKSEVIVTRSKKTTADRIEEAFDAAVSGDLKGKPLEVGKLTQEGRAYLEKLSGEKMKENVSFVLNPSDLVHIYRRHYGKNEKDVRNIPLTNEDVRQISEIVSSPDRIVFGKEKNGNQRNMFFFLKEANDGSYNLMEVYSDKKGNLTAKSFFKSKEGVSQRAMLLNESSTLTSVTDGATLLDGAKLPKFFESATDSEEESYDFRFRDGETGDIWKDQSVGLQERITNAAIRLSNNQSSDLTLRNDAQKAVINNLQILLHSMRNRRGTAQSFVGADRKVEAGVVGAMNAQAMFDRATVKRVSDLARILMQNGYLSGMTSGEMQRLLSVVKNATAMHDISDSVQKIMDIMVNNQLRNAEGALRQLMQVRGSKVDARGVEVQGVLDVDGQRTMEVVKKAMSLSEDDITDRIAEALNRMGDPDQTIADQAALEYAGLNMALDYVQNIANSKAEEKALRDSLKTAKEDRDAGRMTDDAYKQFVEAAEDAIRKNKIERAEAYFNLVGRLTDSLRESIENAKAFREAEKARVSEIHHNANSDMEGRPTNEHHKDDWKDKFVNNGFVQFLFAPLGTFDQILRVFGNKSANGEGYLWNRFMRGWVDCRNKELTGVKEKFARLDEKAAELFGKGKTWGNLIRMEAKMPKATVSFWDGGEMRDHELTQGNLLYIYMVDKMTDGRMKLRRMGITEDDITRIENFLDPRFKALGDWLQDEFLVDTRNEYNETHKRMFGASMAAIENYFPLKILANARVDKEEDVNQQNRPDGITTKTGSIIKRRVNNLALDITGADALSVILDHITQMEHWSAYAEWNRDLNTLRTYKRFRNQVINMTTVYGGGRKLWENFNDLCLMAAGEYRPPVSKLNKSAVNIAKGVTAAKVSFRMYTALKQLLSAPAYAPEVSTRAILKSIANPYGDFKWCLENMPIFRERWHSRISGDPRLLKSDMDWKMWRSRIMELSSRIGMTPNAFVDAVTVSIGARAMYETRLKQYLKEGYPTDAAEKRAMQDATILFNQTQQSSESPFLSTMQVDKDWLSTLFTVFRNSSMSYTRQEFDAVRNLKRNLTPGQRAKSIEFMTKQILRDWDVDPDTATDAERDQAQGAAKKRFRRQIKKDVLRLATFGFILELAWNLGPYLPYIIFGNNEDEKDKMWDDAMTHAYFGSVEGLTGGDVMSSFGNMWASGEWNWNQLSKDMPLASDINTIGSKYLKGKNAEAINDILNLLVQMGVGMNPQSITDTAIAITDACGDDPALSHEAAIFAMRVLQVPQSQIDKMYFDEVDLTGEEASKLTPAQLAQRYAEYKVKRGTPLAPWSWGDEERLGKYNDLATDRMKERLNAQGDAKVIEAYSDFEARYKAVSEKAKEAKELMKTDYAAAAQAHAALQQAPDFGLYQRFGALDNQLGRISKMWLTAKTPEEATLVASTLSDYRAAMVGALQAETAEDQQSAMSELTTLMTDFYTKYQGMQPKRVP